MRITYDPEADALSVFIRTVHAGDSGQTEVWNEGVIVDVDSLGIPRAFEFLCVREKGIPLSDLPQPVSDAISVFVSSGALESQSFIVRDIG